MRRKMDVIEREESDKLICYEAPDITVHLVEMEGAIAGSIPFKIDNNVSDCMIDGGTLIVDGNGDEDSGDFNILW